MPIGESIAAALAQYESDDNLGVLLDALRKLATTNDAQALMRAAEPYRDRPEVVMPLYERVVAERPHDAAGFPTDPGDIVDDVLAAEWTDDDGKPFHPVAYSIGRYHGPILPGHRARAQPRPSRRGSSGAALPCVPSPISRATRSARPVQAR